MIIAPPKAQIAIVIRAGLTRFTSTSQRCGPIPTTSRAAFASPDVGEKMKNHSIAVATIGVCDGRKMSARYQFDPRILRFRSSATPSATRS